MIRSLLQRMGERDPEDSGEQLDPRVKLMFLAVVFIAASVEREALLGLYFLSALLAVHSGLWKILVFSTIAGIVMWYGFTNFLMPLTGDVPDDEFGLFSSLVLRMSIYTVVGIWFVVKTKLYDFTCALEKLRVPICVVMPFIIAIRFIPTILTEYISIVDAMKQRGVYTGPISILTSPARVFRYFFTPILIRCLKMADELTVAAETRGVGRLSGRSYYRDSRIGIREYAFTLGYLTITAINSIVFRMYING